MTDRLRAAIDAARAAAAAPEKSSARDVVLEILLAAAEAPRVREALSDISAGRALLRFTDIEAAIEFQAGDGRLHAEAADVKGKGPKVDATSVTWLGLIGGTLKPWLAFTRGSVVCRAGIAELRWLQQVAERLQKAYID